MRKLISLIAFSVFLFFSNVSQAQVLFSEDRTVNINVPNYWYRSSCATAPGIDNVLSVRYLKDIGINVLRDTAHQVYDFGTLPNDIKAKFIDEQIRIMLNKYPGTYIKDVKDGYAWDTQLVLIVAVLPYKGLKYCCFNNYAIIENHLYNIQLLVPENDPVPTIELFDALKTIKIVSHSFQ